MTATPPPRTSSPRAAFNPLDPAHTSRRRTRHYEVLRDEAPVLWSDLLGGWLITRFDDVATVLREPSMSSDIDKATPTAITEMEIEGLQDHGKASQTIVHLDDPDHARVRKLMAEPFRVREVSQLASLIDQRVADALDRLHAERGDGETRLDLVGDLAYPLPVEVFSEWLGMPEESNPQFRYWTSWVARSRDPMSLEERDELYEALGGMYLYLGSEPRRSERIRPTTSSRTWCTPRTTANA